MLETILGGIIIALVSGIAGKAIGDKEAIKEPQCNQFRSSCQALLIEKIDNIADKVEALTMVVNSKLLRL